MSKDVPGQVVCEGCLEGNSYRCRSYPGAAPTHATRLDRQQRDSLEFRRREKQKEDEEVRQTQIFHRKDK